MRSLILILVAIFALFMLQSLGRTIYVDRYEFKPAAREWNEANARHDMTAMQAAYAKEARAHSRTIDPLWFMHRDQ